MEAVHGGRGRSGAVCRALPLVRMSVIGMAVRIVVVHFWQWATARPAVMGPRIFS